MSEDPKDDIISLLEVSKVFRLGVWKKKLAVDNLSLAVPKGKVMGLLGPNGSGKSTTIKMILGFLQPSRGEILVSGRLSTDKNARSLIGYLPENPRFQKFLTANEIMRYYGGLMGLSGVPLRSRITELLERVGLSKAQSERVQGFSKGMTQRLAIAQSLINHPSLLIFDEPMSGLDPLGRMEIRSLIAQIHQDMPDTTIFFSTHILADVEELCDSVALLRKGRLATHCSVHELISQDSERFDIVVKALPESFMNQWNISKKVVAAGFAFEVQGADLLAKYLLDLKKLGVPVVTIHSQRKKLEQTLFATETNVPQQNSLSEVTP